MKKPSLLKRIRESRLFWPLVAWVIILLFDAIFEPGFFKIGISKIRSTEIIYTGI